MLGLDAAGKTTVLYKLKLNETITTIPTLGFNVETVTPCKGLSLTIWDVGGQDILRNLWHHYFNKSDGLIYVVDSSDHARFQLARKELENIRAHESMSQVPILVFANKQDLPHSASTEKVAEALGLTELSINNLSPLWYVQACCAVSGDGLLEGFQRFADYIKQHKKAQKSRSLF